MTALYYDAHLHTRLCRHAEGEPDDYAAEAARRGVPGITVTDHAPVPGGFESAIRMTPEELPLYRAWIAHAQETWRGRVDVRAGLECDYRPGFERWQQRLNRSGDWDFILGSVHCNMRSYRRLYYRFDPEAYTRLYYDHLARAAETGLFDALSHPDVPKFMWPERWNPDRIRDTIGRALDRIAATDVALELNTSGTLKPYPEMNPSPFILRMMRERSIRVFLGSDAHEPARVGSGFPGALELLREAGYVKISFFVERNRIDRPIDEVARVLRK
ncbi:histidinol-phosphatase [Kiritimatiella glycovorans]|uniref:Histidinol-phosphatase n=1 Tax=Kiritimatiella glycovorans TaxID=1307763 RepID=A0A0G3EF68_9BACT|nr:histidinol-phosphatase [Kiritimatiella glycovorans]AKJ64072.1 Histidinol-phosphatase [Kiritimatiella glycovorans]